MRNAMSGDVCKVWSYAAAAVLLGAWISPLLYNAGKALAEVSSVKTTNGVLEWVAGVCREANFPEFQAAAILLMALLLFFPWMEWIQARRGGVAELGGPWKLRLPEGARIGAGGQRLRKNPRGWWQCCAGFLLVGGLLLSMGLALVPAGFFTLRSPAGGMGGLALKTLAGAFLAAAVMEVFFRGIVMGIFLRACRPAVAFGMSAAFFALALSVTHPAGVNVADPDAAGIGFELLGKVAAGFADLPMLLGNFLPLLVLGCVLGYARWRTGSLWLPVGLHTGWLFSKGMLAKLGNAADAPFPSGGLLQQSLVPVIAILAAGVLAHFLTANHDDEQAVLP